MWKGTKRVASVPFWAAEKPLQRKVNAGTNTDAEFKRKMANNIRLRYLKGVKQPFVSWRTYRTRRKMLKETRKMGALGKLDEKLRLQSISGKKVRKLETKLMKFESKENDRKAEKMKRKIEAYRLKKTGQAEEIRAKIAGREENLAHLEGNLELLKEKQARTRLKIHEREKKIGRKVAITAARKPMYEYMLKKVQNAKTKLTK